MKTISNLFSVVIFSVFSILSAQTSAQQFQKDWWIEGGVGFISNGVSSTPVSGFGLSSSTGLHLKVGKSIANVEGLSVFAGYQNGSQELSLSGRELGKIGSNLLYGGARFNFNTDSAFKPYIEGGVGYLKYDGSMQAGTLRIQNSGQTTAIVGVGFTVLLAKAGYRNPYVDWIGANYSTTLSDGSMTLNTNTGARVTDLDARYKSIAFTVGKEF